MAKNLVNFNAKQSYETEYCDYFLPYVFHRHQLSSKTATRLSTTVSFPGERLARAPKSRTNKQSIAQTDYQDWNLAQFHLNQVTSVKESQVVYTVPQRFCGESSYTGDYGVKKLEAVVDYGKIHKKAVCVSTYRANELL